MSFIDDFVHYSSENECPTPFLEWSALALLSAVAGRKLWTMHGDFEIDPRLYVCMVGTPGSGKSTAMGQAEKIFKRLFPNMMVSESIQSREDLMLKMASEQCEQVLKNERSDLRFSAGNRIEAGAYFTWRPFFCIVDEMENFVSVDERKMVGMLVGLFSRDSFGTGFKKEADKNQKIHMPYLTLLGCTIPEWMMNSLRESLFVGGLGRRLIIVYCTKTKDIPNPGRPADHEACMRRMEDHLRALSNHYGDLRRTPEANEFWDKWYRSPSRKNKENPILIQFHETMHIMVLKVATLLSLSENPKAAELTDKHLKMAVVMLTRLENDIVRLTSGIGRNELAGVGARVLEYIRQNGGVPRTQLLRMFGNYFKLREFDEQFNLYLQSEQIKQITNSAGQVAYVTPEKYEELLKKAQEEVT